VHEPSRVMLGVAVSHALRLVRAPDGRHHWAVTDSGMILGCDQRVSR